MEINNNIACEPSFSWGGTWTEKKLDAFEKYVNAYLIIMNANRDKYGWKLIYFDGFAGSGSRTQEPDNDADELLFELFNDDFIRKDELAPYKGAAERVVSLKQKGFDYYYFIDKDEQSLIKLREKLLPYKSEEHLRFRPKDANSVLTEMACFLSANRSFKALVLLDPFGMQLKWDSIKLLENTGTDLWILIPTGVIVNRLLDRKGELMHIEKLTSFFGKDETFLRGFFYTKRTEQSLFGENTIIEKVKEPINKIAELYIEQLRSIFDFVTPKPLVLYNSRKTPIFHFAFASNNKNAVKIANQIIGKM
jgi:three-Cys-motif partner protein